MASPVFAAGHTLIAFQINVRAGPASGAAYEERMTVDAKGAAHFHIPKIDERVRPVCDSLQINLRGLTGEQVQAFLGHTKRRGMPVGLFGSADNARNFRNWQYSPIATDVDATEAMIKAAIDVRLPLSFEDADFDQMGAVLLAALDDTLNGEEA